MQLATVHTDSTFTQTPVLYRSNFDFERWRDDLCSTCHLYVYAAVSSRHEILHFVLHNICHSSVPHAKYNFVLLM